MLGKNRFAVWIAAILFIFVSAAFSPLLSRAGKTKPIPVNSVIKTQSNLVVVDAIVTDHHGHYVRNLTEDDFHVYQDGKEQHITSFSPPAANAANTRQKHYLVLFFDNSTMAIAEQALARKAAVQFIQKVASPGLAMAVVDFTGTTKVTQNFTTNHQLLAQAVTGVKYSNLAAPSETQVASLYSPPLGAPQIESASSDFAANSILLSLMDICHLLGAVPGRKTLVLFSGGFPLTPELEAELTATINAANRANVAIYPIDARGLTYLSPPNPAASPFPMQQPGQLPPRAALGPGFPHEAELLASLSMSGLVPAQRPGPGGGPRGGGGAGPGGGMGPVGGGGRGGTGAPSGGGAAGGHGAGGTPSGGAGGHGGGVGTHGGGGMGGYNPANYAPQYPQRPMIIPPIPTTVATNQSVLYALAKGTGGFTIFNTNDFLQGLSKIANDINDYYTLGYVPPDVRHNGEYHSIDVKVRDRGLEVRARNGYYDVKGQDPLAGKHEGAVLEVDAQSSGQGSIPVSMSAPYFYERSNLARVNVSLEMPAKALRFNKAKGKFDYTVDVLGIAYRPNGSVAARFSDEVKGEADKKEKKLLARGPFTYQNSFQVAPGQYRLVVVLSAGGSAFGKFQSPLSIPPYSGRTLDISGVALTDDIEPVSTLLASMDQALFEERMPLMANGFEVVPSADREFKTGENASFYVEVYDPALTTPGPPPVGIDFNIVNRKTKAQVYSSDTILLNQLARPGSLVIPAAINIPMTKLSAGQYQLQVIAHDADGNASPTRQANFTIE